jgi:DNA-binding LytR/AlgR family response regulator
MQDFFFIHDNRKYLQVLFSEIRYIEAAKKYVKIYLPATSHLVQVSLCYAEAKLPAHLFCRIHKSYIVSLRHTREFDHEAVYVGSKILPLGKNYKDALQQKIAIWGKGTMDPFLLSEKSIDTLIEKL